MKTTTEIPSYPPTHNPTSEWASEDEQLREFRSRYIELPPIHAGQTYEKCGRALCQINKRCMGISRCDVTGEKS